MQNLINRLDSLEKTARFRERPVLEWATADLALLQFEPVGDAGPFNFVGLGCAFVDQPFDAVRPHIAWHGFGIDTSNAKAQGRAEYVAGIPDVWICRVKLPQAAA